MSKRRLHSIRSVTRLTLPCLAIFLFGSPTAAQGHNGSYVVLLASGFLCDPADPSTCSATARTDQGDSYEVTGTGTFDPQLKSVNAVGTFTHKSPTGDPLETGVWIASELVSFDSYGVEPGALLRQGRALGRPPLGPVPLPMSTGLVPTGGLAVFRIRLLPVSGPSRPAVLQVNCALGDVPRDRSTEGIRVTLEGSGTGSSVEAGGRVMFLALRPEAGPPAKAPLESIPRSGGMPER